MSEVGFNQREQFGVCGCAREICYRGVNAVRFDEVLNFDGLFVFGVIEFQRGGQRDVASNGSVPHVVATNQRFSLISAKSLESAAAPVKFVIAASMPFALMKS